MKNKIYNYRYLYSLLFALLLAIGNAAFCAEVTAKNDTKPGKTETGEGKSQLSPKLAPANFELVMATTGNGFENNLVQNPHGILTDWVERIEAFHYSWGWGITGINLLIPWDRFEPTPGNYQLAALQKVIDFCDERGLTLSIKFLARRVETDGFLLPSEWVKGHKGTVYSTVDIPGFRDVYPGYGCDRTNAMIFNAVKKIAEKLNTYSRAGVMTLAGGTTEELANHVFDSSQGRQLGDFSDDNLSRFNQWVSARGLATPGSPNGTGDIVNGDWPFPNFNNARLLEFGRYLSYNIGKYQRNFVNAVKSVSNIPVIYVYAAASNAQLKSTSNANMNYIAATSDGMYGSEGDGVYDHVAKFRVNSVNLGTKPNGISCVEFDADDWSRWRYRPHPEKPPGWVASTPDYCDNDFDYTTVKNSMESLYSKGVRYINLTMAFCPTEIQGMSSTLQQLRQSYVGKPYVRPTINSSNTVSVEVTQKYRAGDDLVAGIDVYNQYAKYTDNDFWGGVPPEGGTGCAAPSLSATSTSIQAGQSVTITASGCSGTLNWSNGGSGASITVSPTTTTTYSVTCTTSSCTSSAVSITINVGTSPGNGSCSSDAVIGYGNSSENGTYTVNNTGAAGTYNIKISYSRYEGTSAATGSIKVNNGSNQALSLPYTSSNPDSYQELTLSANLVAGNNTFQIFGGPNGYFRTKKVCIQQSGCTAPNAPSLSATSTNINAGQSTTLSANGCAGTITWSHGLGSNASVQVTPSTTTTYTATCTVNGCTSTVASITITVNAVSCPPPTLSASPTAITAGQSATLTASGCSGTINWSNGLGSGSSKVVNPTATTTYTATCTVGSCVSSAASVTVTVSPPSSINCNTLESDFGSAGCNVLSGWVYDQSHPNTVVNLDVYEGSTLIVGNVPAGNFRQDLLNAGKGNGYHGFQFETPSQLKNGQNRTLTIKATGCNYVFTNSPRTINCAPGSRMAAEEKPSASEEGALEVTVAPNPNSGVFDVTFYQVSQKATLSVIDVAGTTRFKREIAGRGEHKVKVALQNSASGTYYVILNQDNGKKTKKVIVIK